MTAWKLWLGGARWWRWPRLLTENMKIFWVLIFSWWHFEMSHSLSGTGRVKMGPLFSVFSKSLMVIKKKNNKGIIKDVLLSGFLWLCMENMRSFSLWCQADEYWHCALIMMTNEQWHAAPVTHGGAWLRVFQENNEQIELSHSWI